MTRAAGLGGAAEEEEEDEEEEDGGGRADMVEEEAPGAPAPAPATPRHAGATVWVLPGMPGRADAPAAGALPAAGVGRPNIRTRSRYRSESKCYAPVRRFWESAHAIAGLGWGNASGVPETTVGVRCDGAERAQWRFEGQ
jgi:hypothetical protein